MVIVELMDWDWDPCRRAGMIWQLASLLFNLAALFVLPRLMHMFVYFTVWRTKLSLLVGFPDSIMLLVPLGPQHD